jgi:hypothetical protein
LALVRTTKDVPMTPTLTVKAVRRCTYVQKYVQHSMYVRSMAEPSSKYAQAARTVLARPLVKVKLLLMLASFLSLLLSVSLYFTGSEQQGIYVGIWVPSILALGSLILAGENGER